MPLEVQPLTEENIDKWTLVAIDAFQSGIGHVLTGKNEVENLTRKHDSTIKSFRDEPHAKYHQVIDTDTGELVAGASWYIYEQEQTEEQLEKTLKKPSKDDDGYREDFAPIFDHLKDNRREIMGTRPYVYLNMLFTSPKHHRRGAGAMLIKWGTDLADHLGLEAYHESSIEAKPLYERFGYQAVKQAVFNMADFGRPDLGTDINYCMYRKAQPRAAN